MNINQLYYAIKLANLGNFTKAAAELFIAQPTLSQQIKKLEEELGIKLFKRESKQLVTLTPAGEDFIFHAEKIRLELQHLKSDIDLHKSADTGKLRIGVLNAFGQQEIYQALVDFRKKVPEITLEFIVDSTPKLMERLIKGELDLTFATNWDKNEKIATEINAVPILEQHIAVVVNAQNPLAMLDQIQAQDLDRENILMVSNYSPIYQPLINSFDKVAAKPQIIGESSQEDVIVAIVESGIACGFLSSCKQKFLINDQIKIIPYQPTISRSIFLCSLINRKKSTLVQNFISTLVENPKKG